MPNAGTGLMSLGCWGATIVMRDLANTVNGSNGTNLQSKIFSDMDVYCGEIHIQDKEIWP